MEAPPHRLWDVLAFQRQLQPSRQHSAYDFYYIPPPLSPTATDAERERRLTDCRARHEIVLSAAIAAVKPGITEITAVVQFRLLVRQLCALSTAVGLQNLQTQLRLPSTRSLECVPPEIMDKIFFTAMPQDGWNEARLTFRLLNGYCARLLSRDNTKYWTHMSLSPGTPMDPVVTQRTFFETRSLPILEVDLRVGPGQHLNPHLWTHLRGDPGTSLSPMFLHCRSLILSARLSEWRQEFGSLPVLPGAPPSLEVLRLICQWDLNGDGYPEEPENADDDNFTLPQLLVPHFLDPTRLREVKLCAIEFANNSWDWSLMINLDTLDLARIPSTSFTVEHFYQLLQVATRLRTLRLWDWWPLDKLPGFVRESSPIHVDNLEEVAFAHMSDGAAGLVMQLLYPKNLKRLLLQYYTNGDDESWFSSGSETNIFCLAHLIIDISEAWLPFRDVFAAQPMLEILDIRTRSNPDTELVEAMVLVKALIDSLQDPGLLRHLHTVHFHCIPDCNEYAMMKEAYADILRARPGLRFFIWPLETAEEIGQWWNFDEKNV